MDTGSHTLPAPGDRLELIVSDLTVDGGALARLGSLVIFLDRGLPGERLLARVHTVKKRFVLAAVEESRMPSPFAAPQFCPHGNDCGGCAWPDLAYSRELAWKANQVRQNLQRIGGLDIPAQDARPSFLAGDGSAGGFALPIAPSPLQERCRNKTELAFVPGHEGHALVGLRKRDSKAVVETADCLLARRTLAPLLAYVRARIQQQGISAWDGRTGLLRFLVVRQPDALIHGKEQCLVEIITAPGDRSGMEDLGRDMLRKVPGVTGFIHSIRSLQTDVAYGEQIACRLGEDRLVEEVGGMPLMIGPQAFFQVNTQAAAVLYATTCDLAAATAAHTVWDLYCGVGGIALALAKYAGNVCGFESSPDALRCALANAEQLGAANCRFIAGDAAATIAKEKTRPDIVIMDPPRAGVNRAVLDALLRLRPERIVSLSCDPATQARDLAQLRSAYELRLAAAVDVFPHTAHVESIALLALR